MRHWRANEQVLQKSEFLMQLSLTFFSQFCPFFTTNLCNILIFYCGPFTMARLYFSMFISHNCNIVWRWLSLDILALVHINLLFHSDFCFSSAVCLFVCLTDCHFVLMIIFPMMARKSVRVKKRKFWSILNRWNNYRPCSRSNKYCKAFWNIDFDR